MDCTKLKEQIHAEIDQLECKMDENKQQLILSDGAIQAFRYVLSLLEPPAAATVEEAATHD